MTLTEFLTSVADAIRSRLPWYDKIKATDFPNMIDGVYSEGEMRGWSGGYDEATLKMWDIITRNGERDVGVRAFNQQDWTDIEELPYKFTPTGSCQQMFYDYRGEKLPRPQYVDLNRVVATESSHNEYDYQMFGWWTSNRTSEGFVPDYGWQAPYQYNLTFSNSNGIRTIEKLRVKETTLFNNPFNATSKLENITFDGVIGQTVTFRSCSKLTTASLLNILTVLSKDATYATGKTLTLNTASKAVIEADTDCSEQLALAVGAGWTIAYA